MGTGRRCRAVLVSTRPSFRSFEGGLDEPELGLGIGDPELGELAQAKDVLLFDATAFLCESKLSSTSPPIPLSRQLLCCGANVSAAWPRVTPRRYMLLRCAALRRAGARRSCCAYLEPVGNFEIDPVDALDPVSDDVDGLRWLEVGLFGGASSPLASTMPSAGLRWSVGHSPAWRDTRPSRGRPWRRMLRARS